MSPAPRPPPAPEEAEAVPMSQPFSVSEPPSNPAFLSSAAPSPQPCFLQKPPLCAALERDGTTRAPHPEREACSGSPVATNLFKKHKQLMPESKSINKTNDGVKSSILCTNPSEPLNFCLHFKSRRERCLPPDSAPSQEHRPPPAQTRSALRRPLGSSRKRQRVFPGLKSRRPVPCAG